MARSLNISTIQIRRKLNNNKLFTCKIDGVVRVMILTTTPLSNESTPSTP